jgi:hypothetical protein
MVFIISMSQKSKQIVWRYWQAMNQGGNLTSVVDYLHSDITFHGFQPLRHLQGADTIWLQFWQPLLNAIPDVIRRPYIFIAGQFEGEDWVMIDLIGAAMESDIDLLAQWH